MRRPRATCDKCGRSCAVKQDGTLHPHGYRTAAWHGNVGTYCDGKPVEDS